MAKTWIRTDEDKAAEAIGGLDTMYAGGSVRWQTSGDLDLMTAALHASAPFSVASGVYNLQKAAGGGFNGEVVTPGADGLIAKIVICKSDGTVGRTGAAAQTGSGGAADAVWTSNSLNVTTLTPVTMNADFLITPA